MEYYQCAGRKKRYGCDEYTETSIISISVLTR